MNAKFLIIPALWSAVVVNAANAGNVIGPPVSVRAGESVSCYAMNVSSAPQEVLLLLAEHGSPPSTATAIDFEIDSLAAFQAAGTGAGMSATRVVYCFFSLEHPRKARFTMIIRDSASDSLKAVFPID